MDPRPGGDDDVGEGTRFPAPAARGDQTHVARTDLNGRAADRLILRTPVRHAGYATEARYGIDPADWLELRPTLQYIRHPGGIRQAADVGVPGMTAAITLQLSSSGERRDPWRR